MEFMTFKDLKGRYLIYDNLTLAFSKEGWIVNVRTGKPRKPVYNSKSGYQTVLAYKNGTIKNLYVHRIIADLYVPNPHGYRYVTHINGDKSDNRAENLRWISESELNEIRKKKALSNG